jgi:hypothetical protein
VREKLFRFTGDELPYTSTVVIDKFEEEPSKQHKRFMRIAATIVVERDGHKAMVIGDKGERLKRIGTEARQELEKLLDAKVFLESGSRCAPAGPTTRPACARLATNEAPLRPCGPSPLSNRCAIRAGTLRRGGAALARGGRSGAGSSAYL